MVFGGGGGIHPPANFFADNFKTAKRIRTKFLTFNVI